MDASPVQVTVVPEAVPIPPVAIGVLLVQVFENWLAKAMQDESDWSYAFAVARSSTEKS